MRCTFFIDGSLYSDDNQTIFSRALLDGNIGPLGQQGCGSVRFSKFSP